MSGKDRRSIVSGKELIPALRDVGYYSAYALAELVDNSVQANAKHIEILCMDEKDLDSGRQKLYQIAILDDGKGMSSDELWNSIVLGKSQNRGKGGIGKYGVGLSHASFSQCKRVEVYSWQKKDEVFYVSVDLDENVDGNDFFVKKPEKKSIPPIWKNMSRNMSKSGTMIVWSRLDRIKWKTASALIKNSELVIGQIYRYFIHQDNLKIRMLSFDKDTEKIEKDKQVRPNDPLFLMEKSVTPEPWNNKAMFQRDGKLWEVKIPINGPDGKMHDVITRYSFVKKESRNIRNAGTLPHGKLAAENVGVSIVRAKREIGMDTHLTISYDPVERWWGAEIEFPPILDEYFGISANKQSATKLQDMMRGFGKQARETKGYEDMKDEESDPLYEIVRDMVIRIRTLRHSIDKMRISSENNTDGSIINVEDEINIPTNSKTSITGTQRNDLSPEQRREKIEELLKQLDLEPDESWSADRRLEFRYVPLDGTQFFEVALVGGMKIIRINSEHKVYRELLSMLLNSDETTNDQKDKLLKKASDGFKKMLVSWAQMEDQLINIQERNHLQDIRHEWGKELDKIFRANED